MIVQLSNSHQRLTAGFLFSVFYLSLLLPARAMAAGGPATVYSSGYPRPGRATNKLNIPGKRYSATMPPAAVVKKADPVKKKALPKPAKRSDIGGPSQPEMSSFKSVGTSNMVNLFSGDFNYNIPLLDVGGYPVNIYYDGGISAEQDASWVGLGWNINPGNVNRNMRGVPDDFNGQDTLQQLQDMKPNKTWGLGIGADLELLGIKAPIKANLGVAFNNYLGPSLDLSVRGTASFKIGNSAGSEKTGATLGASATIGIDVNSRSGTSFSGSVSLTGKSMVKTNEASFGVGLSTGYNSRSGIKALQISEQAGFSSKNQKAAKDAEGVEKYKYNAGGSINPGLYSSSISFVKPSYVPSIRMPLTNTAWSGHFQLGLGSFGVAADVEAEVYGQKSEVDQADKLQLKPMVGYIYAQNAMNNPAAVMDFTRFNDKEVTPNTPVISVPQYSYDVFSIQGEGTGGSIRAFRNDLGYVRDNATTSKDKNFSIGGDIDPPGHYGGNFNTVKTPSTIGEWGNGNKLRSTIPFKKADTTFENVYFRNPGENCVQDSNRFNQIGGTDLVRFVLGGSNNSPTIEPALQSFSSSFKAATTTNKLAVTPTIKDRNKRTQIISFLTAGEAAKVGLDKSIRSYDNQNFLDNVTNTLLYQSFPRFDGTIRKSHHISQINVTENNGRRYVYGVPVYNLSQKDFTFSVDNSSIQLPDKVGVTSGQYNAVSNASTTDGYLQVTTTPPYAHSFLLSGILSPDYTDVTGNGISEDDLGDAVKFNYTRISNGNLSSGHAWRTPLTAGDSANFNPGNRSEVRDDKAIISYGERESWYVQSVESKTMIALFYVSARKDGKGPMGADGGINANDNFLKKLDSIALYSKADLKINGLAKAKAIKKVHFRYSYQLCQNTPDNSSGIVDSTGKLTLQNIYFTYNGKTRAFKNRYSFTYANTAADNPNYAFGTTDRWGTYKPASMNPGSLKNSDYPYSIQDTAQKTVIDRNATAWMLKKIVLPSGGQISMTYETDDYAYVQDRRATDMMRIVGFGSTTVLSAATDQLYPFIYPSPIENDYVFIKVPVACTSTADVYNKYLQGVTQLAFKIWVQMPKGAEYIPCYATYNSYGVDGTNPNIIWVKMNRLGGKSPLSLTALEYLRQQLPGQAFKGYDVAGEPALKQVGDMLLGMLQGLRDAFTDPVNAFRKDAKAQHTDTSKCFVRLNDPDGFKYGGGYRVKSVILKDNWNAMTGQFTSSYGQSYDYTTTESFNGVPRKISSGVASYEPTIGGEENPFQTIVQVEDYLPAGPTSFGAVEMPVLDAFFPSPSVGYSKVTVSSIKTDTAAAKKTRSGIGKQVTEYYTSKDYPVYYNYTPFDAGSVKEFHQASTLAFFNKYSYDYKAQSQGFLVATNDMHGKMKSQSSYAENDTATRINYTENFYRNTGVNGLNDKFSFISKDSSGKVALGNMGIDVDLMTDTREFAVKSKSFEVQAQVDIFYLLLVPVPIPTIWPVFGESENIYRAVTTTKVVNYHSVLDSVVVIDKGSQVSTKNLAYDDQTGEVLVTRTNNEFNKSIYNTSYPAWWGYGGMGLAYKNIDATYSGINFSNGKITNAAFNTAVFESGDELLITNATLPVTGCDLELASPMGTSLIWAFDQNKNTTSLITTPNFIFVDSSGKAYTMNNVSFRVIRSGRRNMLDAKVAAITTMVNPLATGKLFIDSTSKVVNASAAEFKEKWLTDNDVIKKIILVKDPLTCIVSEVEDITGTLEKNINPYRKGLIGNFRSYRNMVFYDNRKEYDTAATTNIGIYGYLNKFKPYWNFNAAKNLIPDTASTQWVWNSKLNSVNAKGLELETVDALGIYTAAQYGYNKTMPVAIANNARYTEMFAENFEDYGYGESISNATYNITKKHIDFSKLSNSILVNTDTSSFKAHSGKYVYAVNAGATANFDIPVAPSASSNFPSLLFGKDTLKVLNNLGGNYGFSSIIPVLTAPGDQGTPSFGTSAFNMQIFPKDSIYASGNRGHYFSFYDTFYVNVTVPNIYVIGLGMSTAYNNTGVTIFSHSHGMGAFIYDELGNIISNYSLSQNGYLPTSATYSVFLCAGRYKIVGSGTEFYMATNNSLNYTSNNYNWSINGLTSPDYKNLNTVNGCIFDKPIAGKDSIINPLFSIPTAKKMVFSGWIREICGDAANGVPCKDYTYTHSQVQLNFAGFPSSNVILNPTGAIVEGWQRYEGTFTAPAGATSFTMNFVNGGTGKMYLDDIRIHPFNANMKSYVYDPVNLRLVAEQDANNYSSFYEYDEEGTLIRTKVETREGVKTVNETRSSLQKVIQ
jgi:hypothetical protein